jgi:hypothetical protein
LGRERQFALFVKENGGFLPKAATTVAASRSSAANFQAKAQANREERKFWAEGCLVREREWRLSAESRYVLANRGRHLCLVVGRRRW